MTTTIRISEEAKNFLMQLAAEMTIAEGGKNRYTPADALDAMIETRRKKEKRSAA